MDWFDVRLNVFREGKRDSDKAPVIGKDMTLSL